MAEDGCPLACVPGIDPRSRGHRLRRATPEVTVTEPGTYDLALSLAEPVASWPGPTVEVGVGAGSGVAVGVRSGSAIGAG